MNELNKQKKAFEDFSVDAEQVLCDKENQIKVSGPSGFSDCESAGILY